MLYLLFSKANINISIITLKKAVFAIFLIGLFYSFCMSIFKFQGWTKTIVIDFQNERLLIYFMTFLLGSLCYKLKIFEPKWKNKRFYILINCIAWIPINLYLFLIIYSFIKPGDFIFSEFADRLLIWFSFHLSLLSLLYIFINTFRYYVNKQGKVSEELNKNSYNVYIIHVIIIGGIALTMLNTEIPSLLKYFILTVSSYVASNLIISFYRNVIKSKIFF